MPPYFNNPYDQRVYEAGFKFVPQSKYLQTPFVIPQSDVVAGTSSGIPSINMGSGGGSSAPFTGGITDLTTNFSNIIADRQNRLDNPPDTFFGFKTMRDQQLTGADRGFYPDLGQEQTFAGSLQEFFKPQSADEIIAEGYTPKVNIGILQNLLPDRYDTLPRGDQAFIARNMGYTGPTIFGQDASGLFKDPFGLNTRSAFGNYAERVEIEADKTGDALVKSAAKRGLTFDKSKGALVDPTTGEVIDEDDYDATMLDFFNKTKTLRNKNKFYNQQTVLRDLDRQAAQETLRRQAATQGRADLLANRNLTAKQRAQEERNISTIEEANRAFRAGDDSAYSSGKAGIQSDGSYNDPFDPGGGEKDGGFIDGTNRRMDFMMGGLADLVDIYD